MFGLPRAFSLIFGDGGASRVAQLVKNPPAMRETWVWSLGWEDPLEKGKATHSSILAWRIPWTVHPVHGVTKSWTWLSDFHLKMEGDDGCTTIWVHLMPLNCIPQNDENGNFYMMYVFLQRFLKKSYAFYWVFFFFACISRIVKRAFQNICFEKETLHGKQGV